LPKDHLFEDPDYYNKLKKIEANEATGSGSVGSYETQAFYQKTVRIGEVVKNRYIRVVNLLRLKKNVQSSHIVTKVPVP
jgi:hypothetical protein